MSKRSKKILLRVTILIGLAIVFYVSGFAGKKIGMLGPDRGEPWYILILLGVPCAILWGLIIAMIHAAVTQWIWPFIKWILAIEED